MKNKILIVDDEPNVRNALSRCLRSMRDQWELEFAANSNDVFHRVEKLPLPDLILCDVMMPGMNGFDLLKKLQENTATSLIPFIFLTGRIDKNGLRHGMELGADDYLTKPFHASEVIAAIKVRLKKKDERKRHSETKMDELRQNIMYALPHELRTPLTVIMSSSELIVDCNDMLEEKTIKQLGKHISSAASSLNRHIENYLAYAQIEIIANDPEKLQNIRKSKLLEAKSMILDLIQQKAKNCNREKDLVYDLTNTSVRIAHEDFRKIILELIDNAFKFSETGSKVFVSSSVSNGTFNFKVTDHGRGMTSEQISKIGAYMQFDRKLHEQQGAGMGLVIVKKLTELYNGRLCVESDQSGTMVTIKLLLKS